MTDDTQELRKLVEKAIQRAYYLGQEYWRLADSESWSDNRRSFDIQDKFDALRSETVSVAGAGVAALLEEIDALRAELQARQWQPIETAPKDGGTVLLRGKHDHRIADGYWLQAAYNGNGAWVWPYVHSEPMAWMPLPPAPPQGDGA